MIPYQIFNWLIWVGLAVILPIGLLYYLVSRFIKKKSDRPSQEKDLHLQLALSKEDAVGQFFFLMALLFFGVTLLTFNRDLGDPMSLRTILLITSLAGLFVAYYFRVIITLIFGLMGLTSWWVIQAGFWAQDGHVKSIALLVGLMFIALFFYAFGRIQEQFNKLKRFAMVHVVFGIIPVTAVLFIFSTKQGLVLFDSMTRGTVFFGSWQIALSLFIFVLSFVGALAYAAIQKLISIYETIGITLLAILFAVIAFMPEQELFIRSTGSYRGFIPNLTFSNLGILWAVIFNLFAFFELVGLIFSGYLRKEKWLINLGALFLFILIIVRFFDSFFTFLDKSIFFISAGAALLIVGWLMEKGRRRLLSEIKQ